MALKLHDGSERYVEVQTGVRPDRVMRLDMQILREKHVGSTGPKIMQ